MMTYGKVEEPDAKRQSLTKAIADMSAEAVSPERLKCFSGYLDNLHMILSCGKAVVHKQQCL
jgi:hypothetical protein